MSNAIENEGGHNPEQTREYPFGAILVLGAGVEIYKPSRGPKRLPQPGRMGRSRAMAAAEAYRLGYAPYLILSGGHTKGDQYPSEAEVMLNFIKRKYSSTDPKSKFSAIPDNAIILEDKSKDTGENMENVKKILEERNLHNILVLTNSFHDPRAVQLATNYGLDLASMESDEQGLIMPDAESLLVARDSRFQKAITNLYQDSASEPVLMFVLKYDPKMKIPRIIAHATRGGIVDKLISVFKH